MLVNDTVVVTETFSAWSCQVSIEFIYPEINIDPIILDVKKTLDDYEEKYSRFKSDSLISRLNNGESVSVDEDFLTLLDRAQNLQKITNRSFTPFIDVAALGYQESFDDQEFFPAKKKLLEVESDTEKIIIVDGYARLTHNTMIDFGGFLKGYVSQILAEKYKLSAQGIIINLGGDLTVRGTDADSPDFVIQIKNPVTEQFHDIALQDQTLCTSGTYKRTWNNGNQTYHHIVDPKTGKNSNSDFVSVSFWGTDGALCDAFGTAAFNVPVSMWQTWCDTCSVQYLAIKKDGTFLTSLL